MRRLKNKAAIGHGARGDERLAEFFAALGEPVDVQSLIVGLRDFLGVDHLVYHSSKLGASPSADPYIRLTYPPAWIARYLQMNYVDVDPVLREGFSRTLPFDWSELTITTQAEGAFFHDALANGVGPQGMSIPVIGKHGHRGLFSISFSRSREEWEAFKAANLPRLIEVANRIHAQVIRDVFGEDHPHLTLRELEVLRWTAVGKDAGEVATILGLSTHTARDYLKSARHKLDAVSSAQAVTTAVRLGLLKL